MVKGKFDKIVVQPTTMYGSECQALNKVEEIKIKEPDMRMLN